MFPLHRPSGCQACTYRQSQAVRHDQCLAYEVSTTTPTFHSKSSPPPVFPTNSTSNVSRFLLSFSLNLVFTLNCVALNPRLSLFPGSLKLTHANVRGLKTWGRPDCGPWPSF